MGCQATPSKKSAPWCILAPPIFFTLWLKYYPIVSAFFISLFKYDPINPPGKFVGFKNYQDMFQMDFYWQSWKNTFDFLAFAACDVLFYSADPGASFK